jgi:hypothetical protein
MSVREKPLRGYMVNVHVREDIPEQLEVRFALRGTRDETGPGGRPRTVPEYVARVSEDHDNIRVEWVEPPDKARVELEQEAARRMTLRIGWLNTLSELMTLVSADRLQAGKQSSICIFSRDTMTSPVCITRGDGGT